MAVATTLTKQLAAAAVEAVCAAQALAAAGNLVINGTAATGGVATLDTQRRILITSNGNDSGITFTVYGTMDNGVSISETVTGANAGSVATSQDFLTVTRVATSGAVATTVQVGTNGVGSTRWWVPNYHIVPFEVSAGYEITSGAVTADAECCDDSPLAAVNVNSNPLVQPVPSTFVWPGLGAMAANTRGDINRTCSGIRLTVTAGTGAAQLVLRQAGIRN